MTIPKWFDRSAYGNRYRVFGASELAVPGSELLDALRSAPADAVIGVVCPAESARVTFLEGWVIPISRVLGYGYAYTFHGSVVITDGIVYVQTERGELILSLPGNMCDLLLVEATTVGGYVEAVLAYHAEQLRLGGDA